MIDKELREDGEFPSLLRSCRGRWIETCRRLGAVTGEPTLVAVGGGDIAFPLPESEAEGFAASLKDAARAFAREVAVPSSRLAAGAGGDGVP